MADRMPTEAEIKAVKEKILPGLQKLGAPDNKIVHTMIDKWMSEEEFYKVVKDLDGQPLLDFLQKRSGLWSGRGSDSTSNDVPGPLAKKQKCDPVNSGAQGSLEGTNIKKKYKKVPPDHGEEGSINLWWTGNGWTSNSEDENENSDGSAPLRWCYECQSACRKVSNYERRIGVTCDARQPRHITMNEIMRPRRPPYVEERTDEEHNALAARQQQEMANEYERDPSYAEATSLRRAHFLKGAPKGGPPEKGAAAPNKGAAKGASA